MIFCVEDDKSIRELIIYALKGQGLKVMGFESGEEMFEELKNIKPKLFLLDIMLPGMDGMEILAKLNNDKNYFDVPVIMLTAKGSEYDKINGLDSGADDYISKPFSVLEMVARVRAVLRRNEKLSKIGDNKENREILKSGNIEIDTLSREVRVDNESLNLTFKEYELLKILIENKGIVMSRERLLETVWGFEYEGETRTVDVHIASLRQKLNESSKQLATIRNVGYKIEDM
ncbi:two-component system, OmpR family, alkaline phosphatase synthesis response regulator PhoP [Peptostreptococcus russellii]|uniref:Stage 0 sporulation protein A homolog n=1 Tax=Peptostreptococcus russellii TaxID=215200 RepID=A0A1H8K1F7_9FIRM|nr:response regulator transcription factor [Peptostreptococcus russellii]SEN86386.1 two-component system, OmpR family, alkaline phosphatase synthesis response regulator PhoP [Peptostreptococcus russellii]